MNNGKEVLGEIMIHRTPVLNMENSEFEIKSEELFTYVPESNIGSKTPIKTDELVSFTPKQKNTKTEYIWTAKLLEGNLKTFYSKGRGIIVLTYTLLSDSPAVVEFTIEPFSPNEDGGCYGEAQNIRLTIIPK